MQYNKEVKQKQI